MLKRRNKSRESQHTHGEQAIDENFQYTFWRSL